MSKHLVDIDADLLAKARFQLGTSTITETVNRALALAGKARERMRYGRPSITCDPSISDPEKRRGTKSLADPGIFTPAGL